jgi:hypothetical protein
MLIDHIMAGVCWPKRSIALRFPRVVHPERGLVNSDRQAPSLFCLAVLASRVQELALEHACEIRSNIRAKNNMKSAYELAMERLSKTAPVVSLTAEQKAEIAELESKCAAKIAERELLLTSEISKATERGDAEALSQLEKQLVSDRKSLRADLEEKKDKVRQRAAK